MRAKETDRQTCTRQTGRQTDRKAGRQTDKKHILAHAKRKDRITKHILAQQSL